ncbi:hypothetical protein CBR_g26010 [Chara braunii]|uniref:Uncharacterized protein n=1 Tax=Chara braunii TaxID=69332 RepID=A0A388L797_CHABU|nr:hypothetical protein CBR_g26010 [Chara braunii]|eukprot:GBG78073.1 hypothetical protein CBR_g26010 [Chara braunii]
MDKLMVVEQGMLLSVDWIAEYQRLTSVPDIQMGFKAIRHYFISRSCPTLSNALTHVEDNLTTTAELFDKAAQIIITNKEAKNMGSSAPGLSRDQHRPRVVVVAAATPFHQTSEVVSANEGDRLAASREGGRPGKGRGRGKPKTDTASSPGPGAAAPAPWSQYGTSEQAFKARTSKTKLEQRRCSRASDRVEKGKGAEQAKANSGAPPIQPPFEPQTEEKQRELQNESTVYRWIERGQPAEPKGYGQYWVRCRLCNKQFTAAKTRAMDHFLKKGKPCPYRTGEILHELALQGANIIGEASRKMLFQYKMQKGIVEDTGMEPAGGDKDEIAELEEHLRSPPTPGREPSAVQEASQGTVLDAIDNGRASALVGKFGEGSSTPAKLSRQVSIRRWAENTAQKRLDAQWGRALFRSGVPFNFLRVDETRALHNLYMELGATKAVLDIPSSETIRTVVLDLVYDQGHAARRLEEGLPPYMDFADLKLGGPEILEEGQGFGGFGKNDDEDFENGFWARCFIVGDAVMNDDVLQDKNNNKCDAACVDLINSNNQIAADIRGPVSDFAAGVWYQHIICDSRKLEVLPRGH